LQIFSLQFLEVKLTFLAGLRPQLLGVKIIAEAGAKQIRRLIEEVDNHEACSGAYSAVGELMSLPQ
jgi:hypothetical protein